VRRLTYFAAAGTALTLLVSGCGGGNTEAVTETVTQTTMAGPPPSRCKPLPSVAAKFLTSALDKGSLVHPVVVRSHDFNSALPSIYFVAARVDGQPALWVMNELDANSLIFSGNDHAFAVSGMGRSDHIRDPITLNTDGAAEALACVSSP
jgi:hypothetical protein